MKALPSCANLTVPPVFSVTQSSHGGAFAAATAEGTLPPETSLLDRRQPGHRGAAPGWLAHRSPAHSPQPVPPGDPSMTAHSRTAPCGTSLSENATSSYSPICAEPHQWHSRAAESLATPQLGQKALRELLVAISLGPCCADIAAAFCCRGAKRLRQKRGIETSATAVEGGRDQ